MGFTWIETAFGDKFLKHLSAFVGLDHEWRASADGKQAGLWVLLWAEESQRLWWQLWDELERQADEISDETLPDSVHCPICNKPCDNEGCCEHVVISEDDCDVEERAVAFAEANDLWDQLLQEASEQDDLRGLFFVTQFIEPCAAAEVEQPARFRDDRKERTATLGFARRPGLALERIDL